MMMKNVSFYSEGVKLDGDIYYPDNMTDGEQRAGVVLCHGYTGVKDLYLPDNAAVLNEAGYVVMTFDYKGWGASEGARTRLAPYSRVADVQAAMTLLQIQPEVDEERLGIYGTSYGCATVVWVAAHDERAKCTVGVVGMGHGARWMRSVRHPNGSTCWRHRRRPRTASGTSEMRQRDEILLPDRQLLRLPRRHVPTIRTRSANRHRTHRRDAHLILNNVEHIAPPPAPYCRRRRPTSAARRSNHSMRRPDSRKRW